MAIKDDAELDLARLKRLLARVQKTIHQQPERRSLRHEQLRDRGWALTSETLTELAIQAGEKIGEVSVDYGQYRLQSPVPSGLH